MHPHPEADRPVMILPVERVVKRLTLGSALEANVRCLHGTDAGRIDDTRLRGLPDMGRAGTAAFLTADVSFGHRLGLDNVVDRVAVVAKWSRRALQIGCGILRNPPSLRSIFLVGGRWIDPDRLGQGRMLWSFAYAPFRMALKSDTENGLSLCDDLRA